MAAVPGETACFGFEIRSSLPLTYLRAGRGEPLQITVGADESAPSGYGHLVYDWAPRAGHDFHARLHDESGRFRFWIDGVGAFVIDPGARLIVVPKRADPLVREERLWGIPAALCLLHRGDLPMHAAAVDVGGEAVLFGAPGRFGKSTLAAGFHMAGHRVLSEDLSCLRLTSMPSVIPGPAMLRIRKDVLGELSLPGASIVGGGEDRVSLVLDRRGTCEAVHLRAVVLLRESASDLAVEPVRPLEAIPDLMSLCFRLPTPEARAAAFRAVVNLARNIPIWNLLRPLRLGKLRETVERVIDTCLTGRAA